MPEYEMDYTAGLIGSMLENPGQQAQLPPPAPSDTISLDGAGWDNNAYSAIDRQSIGLNLAREAAEANPWARQMDLTPEFQSFVGGGDDLGLQPFRDRTTGSALSQRARSLGLPFEAQEQADLGLRPHAGIGTRWEQDLNPFYDLVREQGLNAGPESIARTAADLSNSAHLVKKDKTAEMAALAAAIVAASTLTAGAASGLAAPYLGATGAAAAGGAAAGATGAIGQGLYNQDLNWQDVLLGTGLGGLSGGVGQYASGAGPLARTGAAAGTSAIGRVATDLARGREVDPYGVAMAGLTGAVGPGMAGINQATTQLPPWVMQALTRLAQQGLTALPRPRPRNPYGEG